MARITTRPEEDEEDMDVAEEESEASTGIAAPAMPAVSDRRRRRMMKRGEVPAAPAEAEEDDEEAEVQVKGKDRPTPSQRTEAARGGNIVTRAVNGVVEYLREVKNELDKVTWLSREENLRLTYIVLVVTIVSSLFLGFVGLLFSALTQAMAASSGGIAAGAVAIVIIIGVGGAWLLRDRLFPTHFE